MKEYLIEKIIQILVDWLLNVKMYEGAEDKALRNNKAWWLELRMKTVEEHKELFPEYYKEWVRFLGEVKNVFLRELIRDKKLAYDNQKTN